MEPWPSRAPFYAKENMPVLRDQNIEDRDDVVIIVPSCKSMVYLLEDGRVQIVIADYEAKIEEEQSEKFYDVQPEVIHEFETLKDLEEYIEYLKNSHDYLIAQLPPKSKYRA